MELQARVAKLKAELARRAGAGTGGRFTDALRAETLAVLAARKAEGASQDAVAEELGLSGWTLSRWKQQAAHTETVAAFRLVRVVAAGPEDDRVATVAAGVDDMSGRNQRALEMGAGRLVVLDTPATQALVGHREQPTQHQLGRVHLTHPGPVHPGIDTVLGADVEVLLGC